MCREAQNQYYFSFSVLADVELFTLNRKDLRAIIHESYVAYWLRFFFTNWIFYPHLNLQKLQDQNVLHEHSAYCDRLFPLFCANILPYLSCAVPHGAVRWDGSPISLSSSRISKWEQICTNQLQTCGHWRKVSAVFTYGIYIQILAKLWFCEYHGSLNYRLEPETIIFTHEFTSKFFSCRTGY